MNMSHTRLRAAAAIPLLAAMGLAAALSVQGQQERAQLSAIANDSGFTAPMAQGEPGKTDQAAMAEIEACARASALPAKTSLEIKGTMLAANGGREDQVMLVIEGEGQMRMDIRNSEGGQRGIRMIGRSGMIVGAAPTPRPVTVTEFGDPLMMAANLKSIAANPAAAVVDNGVLSVGGKRMHEVTVTQFPVVAARDSARRFMRGSALSLYFDPETHLLLKSVLVNRSLTNAALEYLQVTSYDDYKQAGSIMTPSRYVETVNGQQVMVLNATDVSLSSPHGIEYYRY